MTTQRVVRHPLQSRGISPRRLEHIKLQYNALICVSSLFATVAQRFGENGE